MEIEKNKSLRKVLRRLLALEDKVKGVAFPGMKRVRQIDIYSCGPAVLSALFSFLGIRLSQRKVITSLRAQNKIKSVGLNIKDLAKAARAAGKGEIVFWKKAGGKISDLSMVISKYKSPVGVEWQGVFYEDEDEDNGHYGIITEVDKKAGYLRMADSYARFTGVDRRFRIKDFEKRWWDVNRIDGRNVVDKKMMFVVTPKGASWPRNIGMKKV
jgi:hypothetical protein